MNQYGSLSVGSLGTNFKFTQQFSSKEIDLKMSAKQQPFCLSLNVLSITIFVLVKSVADSQVQMFYLPSLYISHYPTEDQTKRHFQMCFL